MRMLFLAVAAGCAVTPPPAVPTPPPVPREPDLPALAQAVLDWLPRPPPPGPYSADVHSVRFLATTVLRKQPSALADKIGVIAKDTRARPIAVAAGPGCASRWVAIAPRGWACETAVLPSPEEPTPPVAFDQDEPDVVRGVYGVVRKSQLAFASRADIEAGTGRTLASAISVRARGVTRVAGKRYWITSGGELIDAGVIATFSPSRFRGIALDDQLTLPLAWVHARKHPRAAITLYDAPDGAAIGTLPARAVVSITEDTGGPFVRTPDGWLARRDLRIAAPASPPAEVAGGEKWFDIDLDEQVLVAYEGVTPVYATLVSTGKWDHRTPAAIARVASKLETATMSSDKRDVYSVADVPWTMYYDGNFALHTSYWHDGFGDPRSHGCVNLAPRDARLLYHWSSPDAPPGWTAVYGDEDTPGSLVRVRSRAQPAPAVRGYAREVAGEAQRAKREEPAPLISRRDADASVLRR